MHAENHRWVTGDQYGLAFPADPTGLRSGGPRFLTDAFRVAGVLDDDNSVGQMNMGMAIWGAMSGAETDRLRRHTLLYAAVMGVVWLLDVPALIHRRFGAAAPASRRDRRIRDDESVRAPLQMLSNLLSLWEQHHVGDLLDAALAESGPKQPEGDEGRRVG